MGSVEKRIRTLKKFRKELEQLELQLLPTSSGVWKLRLRNKFIIFRNIPDERIGKNILEQVVGVVRSNCEKVDEITSHLEERVEQMEMHLFGGEDENTVG